MLSFSVRLPLLLVLTTLTAAIKYGGVNIAGFEFGCNTTGTCQLTGATPPLLSLGKADGIGQMQHFVSADLLNVFRLPISWQYLTNNVLGGAFDATNLEKYDQLVQGCLSTGATCVIDIHNYARWNEGIIGQGGPSNVQFAALWTQIATHFGSNSCIIYGLMNEPHDLMIVTWADTVQAAVIAIRYITASNIILLSGTAYASAGAFVSSGSAAALATIKNPDGSKTGLVFDLHQYLDTISLGTTADCATTGVANLTSTETWLRSNGRQALMTETGGGSVSSCYTDLCAELAHLENNKDVYLGWIGWAAGSFSTSYALSLTPSGSASAGWVDQGIVKNCIAGKFIVD